MVNVRRSFKYTIILIFRRAWRLWNHGLRKVPIWKMLDRVQNSFKTVQWALICIFWDSQFGSFSDDAKLLQFLRGCKFSLERTKEKLDLYNSCRSKLTWMLYILFSVWRESVRVGLIFFLEKKWPLRASLPDWFEPWDPSGPIFQKVLNFRWEPQK